MAPQFPWNFQRDITYVEQSDKDSFVRSNSGFSHKFYDDVNNIRSPWSGLIFPIAFEAAAKANIEFSKVGISRTFLQFPTNSMNNLVNNPHVDMLLPHIVCLYYVNDSDGDTILYNETSLEYGVKDAASEKFTVMMTVTPKKGRCVFFNGLHFHSSSKPLNNVRSTINMNLF